MQPAELGFSGPGPHFLPESRIHKLAESLNQSVIATMRDLLAQNIWSERFRRNCGPLNAESQSRLLGTRVLLAGCGGLGGAVAAYLARMGVGYYRLCDPDVFEESNLNRQRFCTEANLGKPKVEAVKQGMLEIATWLEINAQQIPFTPANAAEMLAGIDVAIDCLDSVPRKKMLEQACRQHGAAYLHGSVLGQEGFIYLDRPGRDRLGTLYPESRAAHESTGPNPVHAPAVGGAAALMAALLLNNLDEASPLIHFDSSVPEIETFD